MSKPPIDFEDSDAFYKDENGDWTVRFEMLGNSPSSCRTNPPIDNE